MYRKRAAFTLLEVMIGLVIATVVMGIAFSLFRFARVATDGSLGPQMGLQTTTRTALVRFIKEVQECVEIVRPVQGSSLNYFLARDKLNRILSVYIVKNEADSATAGLDLFDLVLNRFDYGQSASGTHRRVIASGVERLTFTTLSPAVLQIHMMVRESKKSYTLLTTVRTRNILTEGRL